MRGMAPAPRIGGEVWGIAGQVMYDPLAVEPVWPRIVPIDPAKHLPFVHRG